MRERDDLDAIKHVVNCLSLLDGQKLAATPTNKNGVWRFAFDLGGELTIRSDPATDPREAIWTLFFEDNSSLSWMPDQRFVREQATKVS